MRVLVLLGMAVVFISAYVILFTFNGVIADYAACFSSPETISCDPKAVGLNLVGGLFIVSCLGLVIVAVGYVLIKSALFPSNPYLA